MATVAKPKRALAVFHRREHLRTLQSVFRAVIPAAVAATDRQPCVVRNEDLPEMVGHEGRAVGGIQLSEGRQTVKRRPGRIAHKYLFGRANPEASGSILHDTLPGPGSHAAVAGPLLLAAILQGA